LNKILSSTKQKLEILKLSGVDEIFINSPREIKSEILKQSIISPSKPSRVKKEELISAFRENIKNCQNCLLSETRKNLVFGEGNSNAKVIFIGEAPGEQEDNIGKPFVGPAGQLFDKMLKAISFDRNEVYITNIVKCRPPNNRDPKPDEINACLAYLFKQISIIQPAIICALGKVAGNTLLQRNNLLGEMRGKFYSFRNSLLMVTYHPSAMLYHTKWKRPTWEDLKMLRNKYQEIKHYAR